MGGGYVAGDGHGVRVRGGVRVDVLEGGEEGGEIDAVGLVGVGWGDAVFDCFLGEGGGVSGGVFFVWWLWWVGGG